MPTFLENQLSVFDTDALPDFVLDCDAECGTTLLATTGPQLEDSNVQSVLDLILNCGDECHSLPFFYLGDLQILQVEDLPDLVLVCEYNETINVKPATFNISPVFVENIADYTTPMNWSATIDGQPAILYMEHEFNRFGPLATFLTRSKLNLPSVFTLSKNSNNNWVRLFHFQGVGATPNTTEAWDLRFSWSCMSSLDGTDITGNTWQFSAIISRTSIGKKTQSKFIFAFGPTDCGEPISAEFTYNGLLDTVSTFAKTPTNVLVNVQDMIGLKNGNSWNSDPSVFVSITETAPGPNPPQFSLSNLNTIT